MSLPKIWTAQRMIQQVGVTLPETPPDRQHLLHVAFNKVFSLIYLNLNHWKSILLIPIYISKSRVLLTLENILFSEDQEK